MKNFFYKVFVLAAVVACSKEKVAPEKVLTQDPVGENGTEITIKAYVEEGTKTAYADKKTFSWLANDVIRVQLSDGTNTSFANFKTADGGTSATFSASVTDNFRPSGPAVYPYHLNPAVSGESITVTIPQRFFYNRGNEAAAISSPLSYVGDESPMKNLPLYGTLQDDGSYRFQSAMGIAHVTFYNIPADADATFLILYSNEKLWGSFTIEDGTIKAVNKTGTDGSTMTYTVVTPNSDGKVDIYWPLPVGTLTKGAQFELTDGNQSTIYSVTTTKDVVIERNKITELAPVNAQPWKVLGTAKYNDAVIFGPGKYVDVTLEEDTENGGYRINNPYAVYISETGYTPSEAVTAASGYINFGLLKKGSTYAGITVTLDDLVQFGAGVQTGFYSGDVPGMLIKSAHTGIRLLNCTSFSSGQTLERISYSKVLKYQADGTTPANIQLAPLYYTDTGYFSWLTQNGNVQIVFPECSPLDLTAGFELGELAETSTTAQPQYNATITLGTDLTGEYVVSTTQAAALEDINAGKGIAASNGETVVNLPANAATGTYVILFNAYFNGNLWKRVDVNVDYVNPDAGGFTLADVVGTYNVTAVSAFLDEDNPDDDGVRETTLTISRSDDTERGNVMFDVSFFGVPINNWPIYCDFDTETGILSSLSRYAFYWNSAYDSTNADDYQYIMNYHLSYDDTEGWGLDSSSVTLQWDAPGAFYSTYDGYWGILYSNNNILDAYSTVEGERVDASSVVVKKAAAHAKFDNRRREKGHVANFCKVDVEDGLRKVE